MLIKGKLLKQQSNWGEKKKKKHRAKFSHPLGRSENEYQCEQSQQEENMHLVLKFALSNEGAVVCG